MEKEQLSQQFQEKLELFCFFHLGSDVEMELIEEENQLRVSLRQHRIEPFTFSLAYDQLEELLADSVKLERFMLNEITPHRR